MVAWTREAVLRRPGAGLPPVFGIDRMARIGRSIGFAFPNFIHRVDEIGNKS